MDVLRHKAIKKITSFLTAVAMSCSVLGSNVVAFASDTGPKKSTATIINDDEHGTLNFIENRYEDVFTEVPITEETASTYGISINENGEISQETLEDSTTTESETSEVATESSSDRVEYTTMVDPNAKKILAGETVILNATPEEGYSVESVYVVTNSGKSIMYSYNDNTISFTMPKNDVTIRATFSNSISEIQINSDLQDYSTYIRSNLNKKYASLTKFEAVNLIKVKQTIVDENEFAKDNKDITLETFDGPDAKVEDVGRYLLNVHDTPIPVYDVDSNSSYYVAFVNTMQDDDFTYRDYSVANNNNDGEVIDGNYLDANTGILYIKKEYITDLNTVEDISSYVSPIQVQLLQSTANIQSEHAIDVIVNDDLNCLDIETGLIIENQYAENIQLKLVNGTTSNNYVSIKSNNILIGAIALNQNSTDGYCNYDASTGILTINQRAIDINSIEISSVSEEAEATPVDTAFAYEYPFVFTDYPTFKLQSGSVTTGAKMINVSVSTGSFGESSYDFVAYAGNSGNAYDPGNAGRLANALADGTTINPSWLNSADASVYTYTHKVNLSTLGSSNFTVGSGTYRLSFYNNQYNALLGCCHVSTSIENNSGGNVLLRIYQVDTSKKLIYWGLVSKKGAGQTGAGVFVSNYTEEFGYFNMQKTFYYSGLFSNDKTKNYYNGSGVEYRFLDSNGTLMAIFENTLDVPSGHQNLTVKSVHNGAKKYNSNTVQVKAGTYYLYESKVNSGYNRGHSVPASFTDYAKFTIKAGETTSYNNSKYPNSAWRKNYPITLDFDAIKNNAVDKDKLLNGGTFKLYYYNTASSSESNLNTKVNTICSKLDVTSNESALTSAAISAITDNGFIEVATFTAKDGKITPTSVTPIHKGADGVNFPVASSNKLVNCPLGHYLFIETSAPNGYMLDLTYGKPIFYTLNCTSVTPAEKDGKNSILVLDSSKNSNVKRYQYQYTSSGTWTSKQYTGTDYTFELDNTTYGVSANKKVLSNISSIDANNFAKIFEGKYTVVGSKFSLKVGNTLIATGEVKSAKNAYNTDGTVVWTLAASAPSQYSVSNNAVYGFRAGQTVTLVEDVYSNNTYNNSRSKTYTINGSDAVANSNTVIPLEKFGAQSSPLGNNITTGSLDITKRIQLASGNKVHNGTIIVAEDDEGNPYTKTVSDNTGDGVDIDSIITKSTDTAYLVFSYCCEQDKKLYFDGITFEVWYNLSADETKNISYTSYFPTPTYISGDNKTAVYTPSSTGNSASAVKIGTIEFKEVNGSMKQVATAINNVSIKKMTNGSATETGKYTFNTSNARFVNLPMGVYMIAETKGKSDLTKGTNTRIYVPLKSTGSSTVSKSFTVINTTAEQPVSFGLEKIYSKTPKNEKALHAKYRIFWSPDEITENQLSYSDLDSNYLYTGNLNLHLVGEFTTVYDEENGRTVGVVTNNIFQNSAIPISFWHTSSGTTWLSATSPYPSLFPNLQLPTMFNVLDNDITTATNQLLGKLSSTMNVEEAKAVIESILYARSQHVYGESFYDSEGRVHGQATAVNKVLNMGEDDSVSDFATEFIGKKGSYVVVEYEAPEGWTLDQEMHLLTANDFSSSVPVITSKEKSRRDPLDITISKENPSSSMRDIVSLNGTVFALDIYEDITDVDNVNSLDSNGTLYYNVIQPAGDPTGSIKLSSESYINTMTNGAILSNYIDKRGNILFPEGTYVIREIKAAQGYSISEKDHFKATIGGKSYDFGHDLMLRLVYVGSEAKRYAKTVDNTWVDISNTSVGLSINITNESGEPFTANKRFIGTEIDDTSDGYVFRDNDTTPTNHATFQLDMFKKDTTNGAIAKSWTFTVSNDNTYNSLTDSNFSDVNGKPLVEGFAYQITEIDSSNNSYLRQTSVFNYEKGMDIFAQFDTTDAKNTMVNTLDVDIKSVAWDPNTRDHVAAVSDNQHLIDTVYLSNILSGHIYEVQGIAYDVTDPSHPTPIKDANGNYITGSTVFFANSEDEISNYKVNIEFNFKATDNFFAGKTINFYEYLYCVNGNSNKLSESMYGYNYLSEYKENNHVINLDTSMYNGASMNTPSGQLRETTITYQDGTTSKMIVANDTNNVVNPDNFNYGGIMYHPVERIYQVNRGWQIDTNSRTIVSHEDPTDAKQNIYYVSISTTESDVITNSHLSGLHKIFSNSGIVLNEDTIFIYDKTVLRNLTKGEYLLDIEVHDFNTDAVIYSSEELVKSTGEVTQEYKTSTLQVANCKSEKFYITEILKTTDDVVIATHTDRNTESQQGYTSNIQTKASNYYDKSKLVLGNSSARVVDTIIYRNLVEIDHNYYACGYLVDTSNDKIIAIGTKEFTNTTANGTVDVDFSFNASGLLGKTLVVYEYLYWDKSKTHDSLKVGDTFNEDTILKADTDDMLLSRHFDKGDANQTVYIPKLSTEVQGSKKVNPETSVTITDRIFFDNILANETYTIYGYLVDTKNTADESDDTLVAVTRKVDKITTTSGTKDVTFTFDASKFLDRDIVVYEYMYLGDVTSTFNPSVGSVFNKSNVPTSVGTNRLVGQHADSTDAKQTIHVNGFYIDFYKRNEEGVTLAGATFKLTNLTTNTVVGTWTSTTEAQSYILTRGDYIFEEIDAPNGKALNLGIKFTVKEADGTLKAFYTDTNEELSYITDESGVVHYQLSIIDPDLTKLPTAGGNGTLPFTCAGIVTMLAGIAVLKKKRRATE